MKIRIGFLLFFTSYFLVAQEQNLDALEKLADSLYYTQHSQYSESNYQKAVKIRLAALSKIKDSSSIVYKRIRAKLDASKAANFESKQQFDSAIFYSNKAINTLEKLKKQHLYFKGHAYIHLYTQTAYHGDWKTAANYAKETLQILKDTLGNTHLLIAEVEFDYGYAISFSGDYTTKLAYFISSKDKYIELLGENSNEVALKYAHLAIVYGLIGYHKKEIKAYQKAIEIWEKIDYKDKANLITCYGSIFLCYLEHGEVEKAEQYLAKKDELVKKYSINENIGQWNRLSSLALYKKDTTKALFYTNKALNYLVTLKKTNDKTWENFNYARRLRRKANIIKNRQPKNAKELYEEAIKIINKYQLDVNIIPNKISIAQYYSKQKQYEKAEAILDKIDFKTLKRKSDFNFMFLFAEQANLKMLQGDIVMMDKKYQQAFKLMQLDSLENIDIKTLRYKNCKPFGSKEMLNLVLKAGKNYAKAYQKTNQKKQLQIAYNLNLLASEMFAANYAVFDYNDKTYQTVTGINEQLLSTALLLNDNTIFDDVLNKIEQSSSRLCWRKFLNSNQRKHINIPDSILTKESELKTQLHFYKKTLFLHNEKSKEKRKLWKEKIFDLENKIERLNNWLQKEYASYFNQTKKEFSIDNIKQKIPSNQKIIKYIFAKKNVYAFIITKSSTQLIKIANKKELRANLEPLIKNLPQPSSSEYKRLVAVLYNLLLPAQVLDTIKKDELIFILDDILYYVPMEILTDDKGKYLIEKHSVSYASSLLLWNEQLQVKKSTINKFGIYAPVYKKKITNPNRSNDSELIGANNEALQIAELFNADLFLGNKADKHEFMSHAKAYNVLHLAMHSNINNTDSEFSNLLFSDNQDDGKLFISELYSIQLNADLVVLSACNTAVGNLKKGEGLVNVSKAFTYAGVPSTVTSLWKVPDKETSQIMISFYQYLKEGKPKNKALQLAKLDYLKNTTDQTLKHPYYWAGFVISGDTSPITKPTPFGKYVLGISIFFLGIFFLRKKYVNIHKS